MAAYEAADALAEFDECIRNCHCGKGVAAAILRAVEDEARAEGLPWLRLETGNVLHAAHRLYERQGFTRCGPFGDYPEAASSIFMEKPLT